VALIYRDRIRQKASATGTGAVSLGAAVASYNTFSQADLGSDSFPYLIVNSTQFEVGIGTHGAGVLYRNSVLSNSNSDTSLIIFNGSTADVVITNASELSVLTASAPVEGTVKLIQWNNDQYNLIDPVYNATSLGSSINSSVITYNASTSNFQADPNFQYYNDALPELYINGVIQATAKSFKIPHPTKCGWLIHGCLEGPEHAIYLRGTVELSKGKTSHSVDLPEYFLALAEQYTVSFASESFIPIKITKFQNKVLFNILFPNFFKIIKIDYFIVASRKDVRFQLEA
jgi:hypothetical protein